MREWLRSLLLRALRKTRPPYECYWRDRTLKAEAQMRFWRNLAEFYIDRNTPKKGGVEIPPTMPEGPRTGV